MYLDYGMSSLSIPGDIPSHVPFLSSHPMAPLGGSQVNAIVYVSYSDDVTSYAEVLVVR